MKTFDVKFSRPVTVDGKLKTEFRTVTKVPAKTSDTAKNKAFRKICFATRFDDWKFVKVEENFTAEEIPL